jgi:hypothetical protein
MANPARDDDFTVSVRTITTCSPQNTLGGTLAQRSRPSESLPWCFREIQSLSKGVIRIRQLIDIPQKKL